MNTNLNYNELTKQEIIELGINEAEKTIDEGREDLLRAYTWARGFSQYLTSFADRLHEAALEEFETYGEKEYQLGSFKISKGEFGTKYNYKDCGHVHLSLFEGRVKEEKTRLDNLLKEIKALKEPRVYVDEDTGETFKVYPPKKTSTTKLKLTY